MAVSKTENIREASSLMENGLTLLYIYDTITMQLEQGVRELRPVLVDYL